MRTLGRLFLLGTSVGAALMVMSLAWDRHTVMPEEEARARFWRAGARRAPESVERLGVVPSVIGESSGVAVSRRYEGVLWTHNDAGGLARLFALSPEGDVQRVFAVEGAEALDWEDLSLGPCPEPMGGEPAACLYVSDTGDNERQRTSYAIYIVPEPDPRVGSTQQETVVQGRRLGLLYPDGAHDVEALAVDARGGLTLLTKGRNGKIQVFRVEAVAVARGIEAEGAFAVAQEAGTLDIEPYVPLGRMVTGAALSPSGARMVIRTYSELYFYRPGPGGRLDPQGSPCFLGDLEPQGEAVDFLDEATVILISESSWGREGGIHRVRCG